VIRRILTFLKISVMLVCGIFGVIGIRAICLCVNHLHPYLRLLAYIVLTLVAICAWSRWYMRDK